jgi:tetratricopeptide (TPR) repeat protein
VFRCRTLKTQCSKAQASGCILMKKKDSAVVKQTTAKSDKNIDEKAGRLLKMSAKPESSRPNHDPGYAQAVQHYQDGLRALQERKFDRAKSLFQKVITSGSWELADRARVHLNTCSQRLEQSRTVFRSPEEHYDYAVSLINIGDFVGAREHLDKILKEAPKADYAWYGMAVLNCLTGRYEESLRALTEAIHLNTSNRFQARNDSDFKNLADDPRFTELLYPETDSDLTGSSGFRR